MADRYYELAETMNARGAIELAVPFYRQALALLMEERTQLRQLVPASERRRRSVPPDEEMQGLISDAEPLDEGDLQARIAELTEELSVQSADQVLLGLETLLQQRGSCDVSPEAHCLKGKAHLLLGDHDAALQAFQAAHSVEPQSPQHVLNLAAALLTKKRFQQALDLLRPLHARGLASLPSILREPLLRNLSTAERQAGQNLAALQLRRQWLQLNPEAVPLERWLQWARLGLAMASGDPCRLEAVAFLQDLDRLMPHERSVKEQLADAFEAEGDYRQAALLYRDLLRP